MQLNLRARADGKGAWIIEGRIINDQGQVVSDCPLYTLDDVPGRNAVEAVNRGIDHIRQEAPEALVEEIGRGGNE